MSIQQRAVLIVGGGRGIGAAAARLLARQGAAVSVSYLSNAATAEALAESIRAQGGRIDIFKSDAQDSEQVRELVKRVYESNGRLDAIVHSAPSQGAIRPISTLSFEEFIGPIESRLKAAYEITRAAIPLMQERHSGRLVFITSGWAKNPSMAGLCALSSAFGAEVSFVKALARELGPSGITVNAVAPGLVETELSARMPESVRQSVVASTPLGRIAAPDDIAGVIAFLAGEESGFMTGTYVPVSGGAAME